VIWHADDLSADLRLEIEEAGADAMPSAMPSALEWPDRLADVVENSAGPDP